MDYTTIIDTTTSSQSSAVFYGLMGAASGLILSTIGAAYGSSKPNIFHSQSSSSTDKQLPGKMLTAAAALSIIKTNVNCLELFHSSQSSLLVYWPSMV